MPYSAMDEWVDKTKSIMETAKNQAAQDLNNIMLATYWRLGQSIVENEQSGELKAQYGKLSWSHYIELKGVSYPDARNFYENECANARWSVSELRWQIDASLFERLLLSDGKPNKEKVLALAKQGAVLAKSDDILKQPYVFEFLGVREEKPILEKELEAELILHIEDFLLELGRGFMFVGSQQRVTIGNTHYYVDIVFYNKILKAYVLIDLKMVELKPEHAGQMNAYLNYYKNEVNASDDNPLSAYCSVKQAKKLLPNMRWAGFLIKSCIELCLLYPRKGAVGK